MSHADIADALVTFVVAFLTLAATLITAVAIPWLRSQTNQQHFVTATDIANRAVLAVEQMLGGGPVPSALKREKAIAWAQSMAKSKGITISDEQMGVLVEAAVGALNEVGGALTPTPAVASAPTARVVRTRDPKTGQFVKRDAA